MTGERVNILTLTHKNNFYEGKKRHTLAGEIFQLGSQQKEKKITPDGNFSLFNIIHRHAQNEDLVKCRTYQENVKENHRE